MNRILYGYAFLSFLIITSCACSVDSEEAQSIGYKNLVSHLTVERTTKFFTKKDFGVGESYRHDMLIHIARGYSDCESHEEFAEFLESQLAASIEDTFYRRIAIKKYVEGKNGGLSAAEMAGIALQYTKWRFDDVEELVALLIKRADRLKIERKELYSNKEFREFLKKAVEQGKGVTGE